MNLYHGSTAEVKNPQIIVHKNRGFNFPCKPRDLDRDKSS